MYNVPTKDHERYGGPLQWSQLFVNLKALVNDLGETAIFCIHSNVWNTMPQKVVFRHLTQVATARMARAVG